MIRLVGLLRRVELRLIWIVFDLFHLLLRRSRLPCESGPVPGDVAREMVTHALPCSRFHLYTASPNALVGCKPPKTLPLRMT